MLCKPSFFYTINCLQILAELVSGGQVFFVKIVRRGAAADIQPAHDLPAEIVGHEVKRSVRAGGSLLILIGHRGEENGLLFAHQRFIVGVKAVDDRLELGVEVKIIDRRDEDDRIGLGEVRLSSFMSSASNVHSLVRTHLSQPMPGVHVLERRVEAEDLVSRAFRAALELIGQRSGVPCLCALPVTMTIFILLSSIHGISTMIVP